MVDLSDYKSVFADGWTDEDLDSVLPRLSAELGLQVVGVWEYMSEWGPGGSSDLAIEVDGEARELPDGLWAWLVDGEGTGQIDPVPGGPHPDIDLSACFDYSLPRGGCQYHYSYQNS
jgi:hypothetical protein